MLIKEQTKRIYLLLTCIFIGFGAAYSLVKLKSSLVLSEQVIFTIYLGILLFLISWFCLNKFLQIVKSASVPKKRILLTISIIVFCLGFLSTASWWSSSQFQVEITATGSKNDKSNDTEVWIQSVQVDGNLINLEDIDLNNQWDFKNGRIVSYSAFHEQPTKLNLNFVGDQLSVTFYKHGWSGVADISVNGKLQQVDLYSADDDLAPTRWESKPSLWTVSHFFNYILLYAFLFILCFYIGSKLFYFNAFSKKQVSLNHFLAYFLILVYVYSIFLFSIYPGNMTGDSIDQWRQKTLGVYGNHHPIFSTLYVKFLTAFTHMPVIISVFQIVAFSCCIAFILYKFNKKGVPFYITMIICVFYAVFPVNGLLISTLWKDVPYAIVFLLFTYFIMEIFLEEKWIQKRSHQIYWLMSAILISLFKHEGIFIVSFTFIGLLFFKWASRKKILALFIINLILVIALKNAAIFAFNVTPQLSWMAYTLPIQQVKLLYAEKPEHFSVEQKQVLKSLFSNNSDTAEQGENYPYIPFSAIRYDFNFESFEQNKKEFIRIWLDTATHYPKETIAIWIKQNSLVWQVKKANDGYQYVADTGVVAPNDFGLHSDYKLPHMQQKIERTWYYLLNDDKLSAIFGRPALYAYLSMIFVSIAALRTNWRSMGVLLPILLLMGGLSVTIQAQDTRYLYSIMILAPIYLLYTLASRKQGHSS